MRGAAWVRRRHRADGCSSAARCSRSAITQLFGGPQRLTCRTSKQRARGSRDRANDQERADFSPHQRVKHRSLRNQTTEGHCLNPYRGQTLGSESAAALHVRPRWPPCVSREPRGAQGRRRWTDDSPLPTSGHRLSWMAGHTRPWRSRSHDAGCSLRRSQGAPAARAPSPGPWCIHANATCRGFGGDPRFVLAGRT
jgi:hypothetical protein